MKAQALGLKGWVRNLADGRVEAMVEGDRLQVDKIVQWFHQGSTAAQVEKVVIEERPLQKFEKFEILPTQEFRS
ncbi:MAG: acylphosphatase [Spirulinaceae cyanobacterium]